MYHRDKNLLYTNILINLNKNYEEILGSIPKQLDSKYHTITNANQEYVGNMEIVYV